MATRKNAVVKAAGESNQTAPTASRLVAVYLNKEEIEKLRGLLDFACVKGGMAAAVHAVALGEKLTTAEAQAEAASSPASGV